MSILRADELPPHLRPEPEVVEQIELEEHPPEAIPPAEQESPPEPPEPFLRS
jgi:hypothetical protein